MLHETLVSVLKARIRDEVPALYYVDKDLKVMASITYKDLWQRANTIALFLQCKGVKHGENVLLVYAPGLEFISAFFAVLLLGAVPVPTYPPFSKSGILRLLSIQAKSRSRFALIDQEVRLLNLKNKILSTRFVSSILKLVNKNQEKTSEFRDTDLQFIVTSKILTSNKEITPICHNPHDVALIQFTSGSISEPKGVILTHENLIANIGEMVSIFDIDKESRIFSWVPQYHDMGLIGCILSAVCTGCNLYMISPFNFIRRPILWIQALSKFKITHSCGPNFSYELCVKRLVPEQIGELDLSSVRVLINGAEPICPSTIEKFLNSYASYNLPQNAVIPAYGLAEASLIVTANIEQELFDIQIDRDSLKSNKLKINNGETASTTLVSSGKVINNLDVKIKDQITGKGCSDLEVGEILIAGASVTKGYMDAPEVNKEIYCSIEDGKFSCYLKTGDLGFTYKDHLFVTGRKKDLIIHYGKNIYPQDIERIAEEACLKIRKSCCAAFGTDDDSKIILVAELKGETKNYAQLRGQIKSAILDTLDIPIEQIVFIKSQSISKTTSGKIQRQLVKHNFINNKLEVLNA